ncbi:MAG: oligosaccharide flippase family protein [Sulfuricaulis sp.]|uniref:lipopolysaccharide biosynthesis protein n=1 Tax=Sulfuricaulis sp. TaxID=2003553 RepID=UPI0025FCCB5B|nr:oligosaccharide flippase family protein [Sulfuricaulis sp.]MCR4346521.1 oligosaccharide flippase family protein [Sulfuricaulis sp.]
MPSDSSPLGRFFKHSTIYAFGNLLNRIAALLLLPIYTNYLTVAEYGALELFYVIAAVVTGFLSVGIAHATLRFYFEYESETDRNSVVTTNLTVSLLITIAGVLLIGQWHEPLARYAFGGAEYSRGVQIILVTLVLELSSQVSLAYMRAKEYSKLFVGIMFFKLLIQLGANTYFVVFLDKGVEGVLTGNLIAVAFGWTCLTAFVLSKCGYRFEWSKAVPSLKYSFPFLLSTLTGLTSSFADRILIDAFLSLQILGIYALALKFSELLESLIGEPFNRSYGAFRFSIMKDGNAAEIQARIVRYLLIGLCTTGLGIVYFAKDLLIVMSDPAYWPAASILPILMVGGLLKVLNYSFQTGILYEKKTHHIFQIGLIAAFTSVVSNFLLINWLGLIGACFAQVLTASVVLIVTNRISQRYFKVKYEYRQLMRIAAVTVLFYLLSVPLDSQQVSMDFLVKILLYVAFMAVMFFSGALHATEKAWLRSTLMRLIQRKGI